MCCYLSVLSLPTCLILSDKHITGVSTETGPDVRLDRLPSQNDELTEDSAVEADKSDPQIVILDVLGSAVGVVIGAKGKCLQSKCCESCFQSKLF